MEDLRYTYSVARVRVLETRLLKKDIFLNMLDADTLFTALRMLTDTAIYPSDVLNIKDSADLAKFIDREKQRLEGLARELFVDNYLFEAFVYLREDSLKSYSLIMRSHSELLKDFIKRFIDLYNIKTLLRMRYQGRALEDPKINLLNGGYISLAKSIYYFGKEKFGFYQDLIQKGLAKVERDGNFSVLEKDIDDYLTNLLRPAKHMPFGPEAVFGWCLAKGDELRRLCMILLSKLNNVPSSEIQERLTLCYV